MKFPVVKRFLAATATVATVTGAVMISSPAVASAAPCGLSGHYGPTASHVKIHTFYYTIRQCNGHTVKRELDIANGRDTATCHTIRAHSQVSGQHTMLKSQYARGIKPC